MKKFSIKLIFLVLLLFSAFQTNVSARSFLYDSVNVDIEVLSDSRMVVEEELTYEFDGIYRGVFRDITLSDYDNLRRCRNDATLQCGGFNSLSILEVRDNNGKILPENEYTIETYYNEANSEDRLKVTWIFDEEGRNFYKENFSFTVRYEVFGGIGYFDDYDLFYWNAIFSDRAEEIRNANISIKLPDSINFKEDELRILTPTYVDYVSNYLSQTKTLNLSQENIPAFQDFTVIWKLPKGLVDEPGSILVREPSFPLGINYFVNGAEQIPVNTDVYKKKILEGIPPGDILFEAKKSGYQNFSENIILDSGETLEIDVELKANPSTLILNFLFLILNLLGCLGIPGAIIAVYMMWSRKGKDPIHTTIVPTFEGPPEGVRPYLLGSLRDEKVDMIDISSVILDVAYRGYIKIIESPKKGLFGNVTYTFKLNEGKNLSDLQGSEKLIMNSIFSGKKKVTTEDLKYSFYRHIPKIKTAIYKEMVSNKYFSHRPDLTRSKYLGYGLFATFIPLVVLTPLNILTIAFTGFPIGFTFVQCALIIFGLTLLPFSFFMPARTKTGALLNRDSEGFRMFIYHADRYRLDKLKPEMFEKYMSYAMAYGALDNWAEAFKDIYSGKPDWYEGPISDMSTVYIARSITRMNKSTMSAMSSTPAPSGGSGSGSGWSSGGGFSGGFSGGGGGGGGGGAF